MDRSNSLPTAVTFIIFVGLAVGAFFLIKNVVVEDQEKIQEQALKEIGPLPNINVNIGGQTYVAITQVSYAAQNFMKNIPISIEMTDEGTNMKKGCLLVKISGDAVKVKKIEKGDVLLYGESCIVIATEDFKSSAKYKKIGHINNLGAVPSGTQNVGFSVVR